MHVALLMVGAHDGSKQHDTILAAAACGPVILIEPVPHLFVRLVRAYGVLRNVICLDCCIADHSGTVRFQAPNPELSSTHPGADQLGSLRVGHAANHNPALAEHFQEITVNAMSFADLVHRYGIESIDVLLTDTEGYDAAILRSFPFATIHPRQIVFEYKHADGTFNIGRTFGHLLITLDELGYDMQILDMENCIATKRAPVQG